MLPEIGRMKKWFVLNMNEKVKRLEFYVVSLFLSFLITVIATTIFATVMFIGEYVNWFYLYLFIGIVAVNVGISLLSAISIIRISSPLLEERKKIVFVDYKAGDEHVHVIPETRFTPANFPENELEIIRLLRAHENKMLQSAIASSLKISKASVSRALDSLERKGVIVKMRKGVTNEIILSS